MNSVCLSGRLTKDIEIRVTPRGKKTASFTLAVRRDKDNTDFINCVAWEKTAEILAQYTSKGSLINAVGRINTRNYESNGKKVYVTEVIVSQIELCGGKENHAETDGYAKTAQTETYIDENLDLPF